MRYIVVALLAVLFAVDPARADCRRRVIVRDVAVVKVVKEVAVVAAVTPVVATFVGVPLYQAYAQPYVPAPVAAPAPYAYPGQGHANAAFDGDAIGQRLDRLERAMTSLIEQLNQGGVRPQQPGVQPQPMPPAEGRAQANHPGLAVLQKQCADCHGRSNAQAMGKGFVLIEATGGLAPLTDSQRLDVIMRTNGHDERRIMPKGKPRLGDEDFAAVVQLLDSTTARK